MGLLSMTNLTVFDLVKLLHVPDHDMYLINQTDNRKALVTTIITKKITATFYLAEIQALDLDERQSTNIFIYPETKMYFNPTEDCILFKDRDNDYGIELRHTVKTSTITELLKR